MALAAIARTVVASVAPNQASSLEPARILLAEDHVQIRRAIARTLRARGFDVDEAGNGADALDFAARRTPSLALVDLRIPKIDGFGVVRQLKSKYGASLPVIVMSGMSDADVRLRAFDAGADDFVAKPVYLPELLKRIDAFERARRAYADVAAAREREEHLRMYAAEAAALLAHDLNNGLCTGLSNLTYLQETTHCIGEPGEALVAAIRAMRRMSGLVRNFVDITRFEDSAITPQLEQLDLRTLLLDAISIHHPDAKHRGVELSFHCPATLTACLDGSLFERTIHNVLGNAMRYVCRSGKIGVRARIAPMEVGSGEQIVVEVGNTGPSIPAPVQSQIFDKYCSAGDRKANRGMGLFFCRLACEAHHGTISLEDSAEYDVNFVVRLPRDPMDVPH